MFTHLPGDCDNVRRSANSDEETYWVAFASVRNSSNPLLGDYLSGYPLLRKFLVRFSYLTGTVIEALGNFYSSDAVKNFGNSLMSPRYLFFSFKSNYGMIAEVDVNGKIITAFSSPDGQTTHLSEVCEMRSKPDERVLLFGSFSNSYLGRLVIKK